MKLHKIKSKYIFKLFTMFLLLTVLTALPSTTFAKGKEWKDKAFNFSSINTILVETPVFAESQYADGQKQPRSNFNSPQDAAIMLDEELAKKIKELSTYNFIYEKDLKLKSATITLDAIDVILTIKVLALGQEANYEPEYSLTTYYKGTSSTTSYPASYRINHVAEAEILLTDIKTDKTIWQYSERKERYVGNIDEYKYFPFKTWYTPKENPIIVLKDIFANALKKIPLSKPQKEKGAKKE